MEKKIKEKLPEDLKKRIDCLILLNCLKESSEKERLRAVVNCLGLRETARLLGKDHGNLSKNINTTSKKRKNEKRK